jgi:hypothetical protein
MLHALASFWLLILISAPARAAELSPPLSPGNECNSHSSTVFPDVHYFNGSLWCALQRSNELLVIEMEVPTLAVKSRRSMPLSPGSLVFNRLTSHAGQLWMAYRDGSTAILANLTKGTRETLGVSGGNDPVAVGHGFVAWQSTTGFAVNRRALTGGTVARLGAGRPTGLSRIMPDGRVILIDDDRFAVRGGTRPCFASGIVVIEGPEAGNIVRFGGSELMLWPREIAFTPKCTEVPGGWAITNWGAGFARTAVITPASFGGGRASPTPGPSPIPSASPLPADDPTCTTIKPGDSWICVRGGWVPPDHPLAQDIAPATADKPCRGSAPGQDWVCVKGAWSPR